MECEPWRLDRAGRDDNWALPSRPTNSDDERAEHYKTGRSSSRIEKLDFMVEISARA
ncbi:hypothetical protein F2Q70_00032207 [Brassica cretica]|uniref:Uncharacterized protein n=1 Tax=Brassica cretica TaxID=69181 RepID=A0A8S9FHX1_BRACR|nr:hypothetical protein F2Q70_00032207 [Brassica cretica]